MLFFLLLLICFCLFELQHRHSLKVYERPEFGEIEKLIKIAVFIVSSSWGMNSFCSLMIKKLKHIVLRWSFAKKSPFQTDKRTETQSVDPSVYLLGLGGTFFWIFQSSHGLHEKTSIVCQQYWWSFNIISTGVLGKLWGLDQQPSSGCLVLRGLSAFWTLASFHRSKIRWSYNYVRTWKIL